ncbi:MAG: NirA family protein, partial [Limisphaerales bacterium]
MSSLPFDQISGEKLTTEQHSYLEGLFAGLKNRGLGFSDVQPDPIIPSPPNLDALIFEERVKHELPPLDSFPLLLEHAATNKPPERENIFRFKWHGLFFLTPIKEAFMARLRIPAGQLKTFQLREIARVAQELTTGYVQIT